MKIANIKRLLNILPATSVIALLFCCGAFCGESGLSSLQDYLKALELREQNGATLYCEDISPAVREEFSSCKSFNSLRERGCYGYTSYEISREINYSDLCDKLNIARQANPSNISFIDIKSDNWWKKLPAEIMPVSGGIYNTELWEVAQDDRKKHVSGKLLGQLKFNSVRASRGKVEIIIETWEEGCGEVQDYFEFSPILLADFDGDGISELLLNGSRFKKSETCYLGTGNMLGAGFSAIVKLTGESQSPSVKQLQ